MADRYIDAAYVEKRLGRGFVDAVEDLDGIDTGGLESLEESATAVVQGTLRRIGYVTPTTQNPADITDEIVKNAVLWVLWTHLAQLPESSIEIPKNYKENLFYLAFDGIRNANSPSDLGLSLSLAFDPSSTIQHLVGDRVI